jgi:carbon storage regulator CsrA
MKHTQRAEFRYFCPRVLLIALSRKEHDEVVIGKTIRVVVLKVTGGRVKLGFTAPKDVVIRREELCSREPQTARL